MNRNSLDRIVFSISLLVFMTASAVVAAGEYVGERNSFNRFHGMGTYSGRGLSYEGQWIDGRKNGKGKQTWPNGDVYDGAWVDNKRHGRGVQSWANGDQYAGEWASGKRTGKGVYSFANGTVFTGVFRLDQREGEGEIVLKDGSRFKGVWSKDQRNGKGLLTHADGAVLEGEWQNDEYVGNGPYATKEYRYVGPIKLTKPHGRGNCTNVVDGKSMPCEFNNGIRVLTKVEAVQPKPVVEPSVVSKPNAQTTISNKVDQAKVVNEKKIVDATVSQKADAAAVANVSVTNVRVASTSVVEVATSTKPAPLPGQAASSAQASSSPYVGAAPELMFAHDFEVNGYYKTTKGVTYTTNARKPGDLRVRVEDENYLVTITIDDYKGSGNYEIHYFGGVISRKGIASYATSSDQPGKVTITSDKGNMISGTFEMPIFRNGNISSGDAKTITNGRFTAVAK